MYTFRLGPNLVCRGRFHNIYIRLRSRMDSGRIYYYLVFSGYRIDKVILTRATEDIKVSTWYSPIFLRSLTHILDLLVIASIGIEVSCEFGHQLF
jgi:hypothetical protein